MMVKPLTSSSWTVSGQPPALTSPGKHRRPPRRDIERLTATRGLAPSNDEALDVTPKVLVVDDERPVANYLAEFLNAHGARTTVAYDGVDAGRKVQTFRPDLILLDLLMPNLDGFEVCAQLKADPSTRGIRIVAMTGIYTRDCSLRALEAGAEQCLPKPLEHDRLLKIVGLPAVPPTPGNDR